MHVILSFIDQSQISIVGRFKLQEVAYNETECSVSKLNDIVFERLYKC